MCPHRCAGGLKKKLYLRSGSQRHRHFAGFFNVPILHRHGTNLFLQWFRHTSPLVAFYDTLGIRRMYSRLKPPASSRGVKKRYSNIMHKDSRKEAIKSRLRHSPSDMGGGVTPQRGKEDNEGLGGWEKAFKGWGVKKTKCGRGGVLDYKRNLGEGVNGKVCLL